MKNYTEDEQALIRQHETTALNTANERFESARHEYFEAKADHDRWQDGLLAKEVTSARMEFIFWMGGFSVIVLSFGLNCFLMQEITPDLSALIQRLTPFGNGFANAIATGTLTGILFAILWFVKKVSDLKADLSELRPGLHPAVARPLRQRIKRKTGIKLGYLLLLGIGYAMLYRYIASGELLEQASAAAERELNQLAGGTLRDPESATSALDQAIASSQATSFAVYYCLEWLLHATILFVNGTRFPAERLHLLRLSSRKDHTRFRETNRTFQSATSTLRRLCQPKTPDDGVNSLRSEYLTAMAADREPSPAKSAPQEPKPPAVNGHSRTIPVPDRG
jgi:hypothetical protein